MKQKGFSTIFIVFGLLIIGGLVAGGYYLIKSSTKPQIQNPVVMQFSQAASTAQATPNLPNNTGSMLGYTNRELGFKINYPQNWYVLEDYIGKLIYFSPIKVASATEIESSSTGFLWISAEPTKYKTAKEALDKMPQDGKVPSTPQYIGVPKNNFVPGAIEVSLHPITGNNGSLQPDGQTITYWVVNRDELYKIYIALPTDPKMLDNFNQNLDLMLKSFTLN